MNGETKLETMNETINEVGTKAMENLSKLAELNMKLLEKITSRQMEAMNFMVEQSKRQMKLATESKDLKAFLKGQADLAKEASERMLEESKESMKVATEVREDYQAFVKEEMGLFSEKIRKITPTM